MNGLFLPRPAATTDQGVQLRVVDLAIWEAQTAAADSTGLAYVETDPIDFGYYWRVERIVVQIAQNGTTIPDCSIYGSAPGPAPRDVALRDHTRYGLIGVAEYPATLLVLPSTCLRVEFAGAAVGAVGAVSVQYQLVQRIGG